MGDMASMRKLNAVTSGNLTGREVAMLRLGSWAQELRGEEPTFGDAELQEIERRNLSGQPAKAKEYNGWMELSQGLQVEVYSILTLCLDARLEINRALASLQQATLAYLYRIDTHSRPLVMTEAAAKTYREESVKRQIQRRLEGWFTIQEVFDQRAYALVPEKLKAEVKTNNYVDAPWWNFVDTFPERAMEIARDAIQEIQGLVDNGKLKFEINNPSSAMLERWPMLTDCSKEEAIYVSAEWLDLSTLMDEEKDEALTDLHGEFTICGCQGKNLFALNQELPEWQQIITEYKQAETNDDLPYGRPVAIIQEPYDGGFVNDDGKFESFGDDAEMRLEAIAKGMDKLSPEVLWKINEKIRGYVKAFMVKLGVQDVLTEETGINFTSHLTDNWAPELKRDVEVFNKSLHSMYLLKWEGSAEYLWGSNSRGIVRKPIEVESFVLTEEYETQLRNSLRAVPGPNFFIGTEV
ncbi:hypothetical protein [Sneathiella litorea]|uniref:Uncharacterized protein n=1 Tax=Sneathiella litorea TaxID=2606216 RepID=A0A6L8W533_9PROT|nr:hypothetical protein [Sneathiella litorea]MZR29622.1 hypothetical protein [Sneathiella litorea]